MASLKKWLLIAALLFIVTPNISHFCFSQMRLIPLDEFCEDVFQRNPGKLPMYSNWREISQKRQGECTIGDPRLAINSWSDRLLIRLSQMLGDRLYTVRISAWPPGLGYLEASESFDQCKLISHRNAR